MKTTIATVKNEFRLTEWSAQIQAQKSSGLTVHKWCEENGVNVNTVYLNFVPIISLLICFLFLAFRFVSKICNKTLLILIKIHLTNLENKFP
ncbi:IS66 family insertion sequence element accessory protein TnpA, partial [Ruminococcus sp.]